MSGEGKDYGYKYQNSPPSAAAAAHSGGDGRGSGEGGSADGGSDESGGRRGLSAMAAETRTWGDSAQSAATASVATPKGGVGSVVVGGLSPTADGVAAAVSADPVARNIADGFRINFMTMSNATTGEEIWNSGTQWDKGLFENELEAHVPASILGCPAVAREINFSSREEIENFRLEQRVYFQGMLMEEWFFDFGFVIPGSTNSWQSTIEAAGEGNMMPASLLNGRVQIVTSFFDGPLFVSKSTVRVFYDK